MKRTCFVISPIGKEGSSTRQEADEFLQFLVEPALEKYDFDVIRADKIPRPSVITSDIIRLVQESDLCIIDITSSNPNVFYECGRRHETGRPFLQLIKNGKTSEIPFDVAGIRTLEYDVSTTPKARSSVKELQTFIDEIIKGGFGDKLAGHTMASIGEALDRIERKMNVVNPQREIASASKGVGKKSKIELLTMHPENAFTALFESEDFAGAFATLERVKIASGVDVFLRKCCLLARASYTPACEALLSEIESFFSEPKPDVDLFDTVDFALKEYYSNTGKGAEGIAQLIRLYEKAASSDKFDSKSRAKCCNRIGMLAWRFDMHDIGQKYEEITVALDSASPAYWYNKSLTHQKLKQKDKLIEALRSLAKCDGLNDDHREILSRHGVT